MVAGSSSETRTDTTYITYVTHARSTRSRVWTTRMVVGSCAAGSSTATVTLQIYLKCYGSHRY